jgi:hypothetical protein
MKANNYSRQVEPLSTHKVAWVRNKAKNAYKGQINYKKHIMLPLVAASTFKMTSGE